MAELPQPDMSHLTPEERRIIEGVLMRQKEEEEQDHEIMRRKQDEVQILEETIRMRSEKHKKAGVELNATCHICLKTKFADGVGHICNYCDIRCCARCGGKVTLRSSKVIWVCILCRKKQELLSKTGQWMAKTGLGAVDSALLRQMQEDLQVGGRQGLADQTRDKRPKLERAHSAAEKENLPLLQRSGNCPLRRQYSQQEQISGRRMSTSDSGVEMSVSPHARTLPTPHVVSSYPVQQTPRHPAAYPDDDPNLYRGELDGLMRQHPPNYQRQRSTYQDSSADLGMTYGQTPMETGSVRTTVHPSQQHSLHQTQGVHPVQPTSTVGVSQQRSFSSSEEERSTPECASDEPDESEKGKGYYHHAGGPKSMSSGGRRHNGSHNGHHGSGAGMTAAEHNGHHPPREPRKEESTLVRRSFRRCGDEWRADSRRFTEKREKKTVRFDGGTNVGGPQEEEWSWEADRQGSQDSATKDSGIDTSSTFTSSEDSNRGDLPKHPSWQVSEDGQKIIGHMILRKSAGTGSCSSILGLKVVGGKLLEDGSMGALIEKVKKGSTADVEGHLRPGDEVIAWNGRSLQGKSFREVYDIIAESRLEPQIELVVERKLSSTTTGMAGLAGPGPSTPMASRRIVAQSQWRQKHETISGPPTPHHKGLKKCLLWELYDARREKPSVLVTSPGSPDLHAQGRGRHSRHPTGNANVGGSIQVKLGYDLVGLQLIVTIICASGLTPKSNGQPRNPYAKVFLLPDKSEKSKRRTKTVANTNDPRWNQTFVYNGVRRSELKKRALEITVWDYARYEANDFLGETVLELAVCLLDEEPEWHSLTAHGEHRHVRHYQDSEDMIDCHLSPPSTTSRLSDSDTSECDITDYDVSREQRRTADGASISSIGSSSRFHNMPSNYKRHYSSPPPERELYIDGEHRSRRDMSPQGRKRAALMISRDQPASISSYQTYRKDEFHRGMMGHRSHSAAPMDSPSVRYRGRSQSPTGHRSLSPPEHRSFPYSHGGYVHTTRFGSRSATATPTGSPKKRQLPQIPAALKERVAQDFEERARFMRHRNRQSIYRSTGMGGWEKHYSGLSDSDLPSIGRDPLTLSHSHAHRMHRSRRGHLSPDKDVLGGDLGDSDMESIASVTSSAFSTQSERPRGSRLIEYTSQSSSYEKTSSHRQVTDNGHNDRDKRSQFTRSLSNADVPQDEKDTGSFSDTAIALNVEDAARRGRKSSPGSKSGSGSSSGSAVQYQAGGLGKKSNSTSQLSATGGTCVGEEGRKRRLGFGKKGKSSFTVHRSEEVLPPEDTSVSGGRSGRQPSSASSDGEGSGDGDSWSPSLRMAGEGQLRDFIEDLGPGQVVGRQALGARCLGEIQLSLSHTKGYLEVEVIRAKDLKAKQGSKVIPAPYVKLYLVNGKRCIEKAKTTMARKTLDPFYQQLLAFKENCRGCILQVTVWGDYGRIEGKKVFMGIAQIVLDELDLSQMVFGWYKLFDTQALVSGAASLALSRRSSVTSLDSFKI
ncbi:regulating synaptic membrane exocytosis protein 2 isoform X2 [Monomorium pharaonis]|uniref:regulating synaptic membrane exocytosis protein 2 isoform X2 n=1 Tax=Monomorium pharaonis TaxID=307658 RepID=UPI00063F7B62|nr:regulating synaptic membrane exocytosis protein 2 isoform X2 [Monomorium pharaonis]